MRSAAGNDRDRRAARLCHLKVLHSKKSNGIGTHQQGAGDDPQTHSRPSALKTRGSGQIFCPPRRHRGSFAQAAPIGSGRHRQAPPAAGIDRGDGRGRCDRRSRSTDASKASMIGVDTNVLVRYMAQDDPIQSKMATDLIERRLTESDPGFISEAGQPQRPVINGHRRASFDSVVFRAQPREGLGGRGLRDCQKLRSHASRKTGSSAGKAEVFAQGPPACRCGDSLLRPAAVTEASSKLSP